MTARCFVGSAAERAATPARGRARPVSARVDQTRPAATTTEHLRPHVPADVEVGDERVDHEPAHVRVRRVGTAHARPPEVDLLQGVLDEVLGLGRGAGEQAGQPEHARPARGDEGGEVLVRCPSHLLASSPLRRAAGCRRVGSPSPPGWALLPRAGCPRRSTRSQEPERTSHRYTDDPASRPLTARSDVGDSQIRSTSGSRSGRAANRSRGRSSARRRVRSALRTTTPSGCWSATRERSGDHRPRPIGTSRWGTKRPAASTRPSRDASGLLAQQSGPGGHVARRSAPRSRRPSRR